MLKTPSEIIESLDLSHIKRYVIVGANKKTKGVLADADDFFTAKRYEKILKPYFSDLEVLNYPESIDYISKKFFGA
jgi:hypothetical protein